MPKAVEGSNGGVLAIHLGSNVGYCINGRPAVWVLPRHSGDGYVGAAMLDALGDMLERPDHIMVTAPLDNPEDPSYASLTVGLAMVIQVFGCRRSIPVELVHPKTVQKAMFDKDDMTPRQVKSATIGLAKRRGLTSADPDAAGALVLHEYAVRLKADA